MKEVTEERESMRDGGRKEEGSKKGRKGEGGKLNFVSEKNLDYAFFLFVNIHKDGLCIGP